MDRRDALVVTLLAWFREAVRDYDHLESAQPRCRRSSTRGRRRACTCPGRRSGRCSARSDPRRCSAASSSAAGSWSWRSSSSCTRWSAGWSTPPPSTARPSRRTRPGTSRTSRTRRLPMRTLQVFAVLFVLVGLNQLGIFPPAIVGVRRRCPARPAAPSAGGPIGAARLAPARRQDPRVRHQEPRGRRRQAVHDLPAQRGFAGDRRHTTSRSARRDGTVLKNQPPTDGGASQAYQYDAARGRHVHVHLLDPSHSGDDRDADGQVGRPATALQLDRRRRLILIGLALGGHRDVRAGPAPGHARRARARLHRPGTPIARGQPAPAVTGTTLRRRRRSTSRPSEGRPVIVNFWGPSCVPCRDEFPLFTAKLARARGGRASRSSAC